MAHERLRPEFVFDEEKIKQLKKIAPECFEDGKINFETLRQNLGDWVQEDDKDLEHFGLFWPGKHDARRIASIPSQGTLEPIFGEGLTADGTRDIDGLNDSGNIFIEGENLEVLKILQKSYAGKVKMIYIDPPYNTGSDFVYDDDFTEPLQEYLRRTGQVDEEGKPLTTNKRSDGRFHSKWLSMIYPRLRLARNLLREDGIIFISIDDNEVHNLRAICNEVFGEENFIEEIIWKNKYNAGALTKGFSNIHEYILCYSKNELTNIEAPLDEEAIKKYNKTDEKFEIRGAYVTQPLATGSKDERPNLRYPIYYEGVEIWPEKQWIWSKERVEKAISNNEVVFNKDGNSYNPRVKQYLKDENGKMRKGKPISILVGPYNQEGSKEIKDIFNAPVFDFPKPSSLLKYLASFTINDKEETDGIYLDFFSGSATLAHAIIELNKEDNGKRQFICVQLPEKCEPQTEASKKGFKTIADISKERIRLISKRYLGSGLDIGFRAFALRGSSYKQWNNYIGTSAVDLERTLDIFNSDPLVSEWTKNRLMNEIILLEGFLLSSKLERQTQYGKNEVTKVSSDSVEHTLLICLDKKIGSSTVESIDLSSNDILICLDSAIGNVEKLRLSDKGLIKTI